MTNSLITFLAPRLPYMQSFSSDAALQSWARQVVVWSTTIHPMSTFSRQNPNSFETAVPGTWGRNIASNASVMWLKQVGSGTTGWVAIA